MNVFLEKWRTLIKKKIEQYLHKIEKPLKKKPEAEMKVEESQNIQQESEKKEEKEEKIEKTTNEIPNMSSVDQNYIIFGSIGLILAICFSLLLYTFSYILY